MEKLFSYGTLQLEQVQLENFGRKLQGTSDILTKYKVERVEIKDQEVIKTSGIQFHPILRFTNKEQDKVIGVIFEVTKEELLKADIYEEENYKRVLEKFKSGTMAWVYTAKN